jgi:hypothetical protein
MDYRLPYFIILLLGIIAGLYRYKQLISSSKLILGLLISTFIFELLGYFSIIVNNNNLMLYNAFTILQFGLLTCIYHYETRKKWILWSNGIFLLLFLLTSDFQIFQNKFNTSILLISFFLTIVFGLFFLYKLFNIITEESFLNFPVFWFSIGFIIFCVLNIFDFGTMYYLQDLAKNDSLTKLFDFIRIYSNYFLYAFVSISFFVKQNSLSTYYGGKK